MGSSGESLLPAIKGLTAARQATEEAKNTLPQQAIEVRNAEWQLSDTVRNHPELSPLEKLAWLLSVDSEDPSAEAEVTIAKLEEVEALVSQPGVPIVSATIGLAGGRSFNVCVTDGSGLTVNEESFRGASIGHHEEEGEFKFTGLSWVSAELLSRAVTKPAEVDDLDTTGHHKSSYLSNTFNDAVIIGTEAIQAYFLQLLAKEQASKRQAESYLIEEILQQAKQQRADLIAGNEQLAEWHEQMRSSRLDLAAKYLLNRCSRGHYKKPHEPPEAVEQLMALYEIDYEKIRQQALTLHEAAARSTRQAIETAQPPLVRPGDKLR